MCREANKAQGAAECLIWLETQSEYNISGNVRGYTGTLTGLLYVYGAFQTGQDGEEKRRCEPKLAVAKC